MESGRGRNVRPHLAILAVATVVIWGGAAALWGQEEKEAGPSDPYFQKWRGWELRPLNDARKLGKLIFQSEFSPDGIERDWKADGVAVEAKDGTAILSLSAERIAAKKSYGALWAKTPFAQPLMIEVEFTLDPAGPHDANVFWGQKNPIDDGLGKEQECYVMGWFGWGGRSCGFERASDWHVYGISGAADPKPGVKRTGVWIVKDKLQCLYLDDVLLVYSMTPSPPPESGHMALSVYQSKVLFHSVKVYSLPAKKK